MCYLKIILKFKYFDIIKWVMKEPNSNIEELHKIWKTDESKKGTNSKKITDWLKNLSLSTINKK